MGYSQGVCSEKSISLKVAEVSILKFRRLGRGNKEIKIGLEVSW